MRNTTMLFVATALLALPWLAGDAPAQGLDAARQSETGEGESGDADDAQQQPSPLDTLFSPVSLLIILLSIATVALVIEHVMTIREPVLMPPGLADQVRELVAAGKLGAAVRRCREQPSFLGFVLEAGLAEADGGWSSVEKATEDALADQSARLFRKIEYLSVIGNIAPMLGLLGTVIGMILAFREVASTQGLARGAGLAEGIYLALVTTVEGLIVAIPALAAFAVLRNRVDQLVAETAYATQHVLTPLKRARSAPPGKGPAPPAPPPVRGQ